MFQAVDMNIADGLKIFRGENRDIEAVKVHNDALQSLSENFERIQGEGEYRYRLFAQDPGSTLDDRPFQASRLISVLLQVRRPRIPCLSS